MFVMDLMPQISTYLYHSEGEFGDHMTKKKGQNLRNPIIWPWSPDAGAVRWQLPKNVQRQLPLQSLEPTVNRGEIAQSQVT